VELGVATENQVQVIGNVRAGDLVVIQGHERLRIGQQVAYEPPDRKPK
jgi:hypothetical protein